MATEAGGGSRRGSPSITRSSPNHGAAGASKGRFFLVDRSAWGAGPPGPRFHYRIEGTQEGWPGRPLRTRGTSPAAAPRRNTLEGSRTIWAGVTEKILKSISLGPRKPNPPPSRPRFVPMLDRAPISACPGCRDRQVIHVGESVSKRRRSAGSPSRPQKLSAFL